MSKVLLSPAFRPFNSLFELGEHHALAENEGVIAGLAALEGLAVLLAQEVDDHAVFLGGGAVYGFVGNPLLAQDVQGLVHFSSGDFQDRALDVDGGQVTRGEFGIDLEDGGELEVSGALGLFRLDAGVAGNAQVLADHGFAEHLVQGFGEHFMAGLVAILLLDDIEGDLARAEARHLHVLAQALQALLHVLFDISDGDGEVQTAFQFVGVCGGRFHE